MAAVALLSSVASAQTAVPLGTVMNTSVGTFVRDRVGWSLLDGQLTIPVKMNQLALSNTVEASFTAVAPKVGQYAMRYAGGILFAGSLIYAALDWFYNSAKLSTGTSLDEYGYPGEQAYVPAPAWATFKKDDEDENFWCGWSGNNPDTSIKWAGQNFSEPLACKAYLEELLAAESPELPSQITANVDPVYGLPDVGSSGPAQSPYDEFTRWQVLGFPEGAPYTAPELADFLSDHPDAAQALNNNVVPSYLSGGAPYGTGTGNFPYTYAEPYGPGTGVELDPAPNANQWTGNPFYDPSLDTDGDGYTDAEETVAGTDPNDPTSTPTVSPWPDPDPGEDPLPDVDGDGIPDPYDPCPFHQYNGCAAMGDTPEIEFPDDYAREPTVERTATATEGILDWLENDQGATPEFTPFAAPEAPDLSPLESWLPDLSAAEAAWSLYMADVEADFGDLLDRTQVAFPFGMGAALSGTPTSAGSECVEFEVTFGEDLSAPANLCSVPVLDNLLATTGRGILEAVMTVAFVWSAVALVLRS